MLFRSGRYTTPAMTARLWAASAAVARLVVTQSSRRSASRSPRRKILSRADASRLLRAPAAGQGGGTAVSPPHQHQVIRRGCRVHVVPCAWSRHPHRMKPTPGRYQQPPQRNGDPCTPHAPQTPPLTGAGGTRPSGRQARGCSCETWGRRDLADREPTITM